MNGLSVIITICVLTVLTVISVTVMIHYNKQFHQCDADSAFWCHSDWQCLYGTQDPKGAEVGNPNNPNSIPMKCYILGAFGKINGADDPDCGKWFTQYNRLQTLCDGASFTNAAEAPICKGSGDNGGGGKWPCSCDEILDNDFGKYAFKTGFTNNSPGGQFIMNKKGGVASCNEGEEGCVSFRKVICSQVGVQIAGMQANGKCPANVDG